MMMTRRQDHGIQRTAGHPLRHVFSVVILVGLLLSLDPGLAWSLDTKIMQAQQKLSVMGYDPGAVDGVLGPRTRQALQAFQQDHDLPSTGTLDAQTLEALGFITPATRFESLPLQPPPAAPWRAVLTYLRYYDTQPALLLQVITEH